MEFQSAEAFVELRTSTDLTEQDKAAHASASVDVWLDVIRRYPDMRRWVARNKTVPLEVLRLLATDPDRHVRTMVAMKRKLTPDLLDMLADDLDESVRMRVARHRRTSRETLTRLANDPWPMIAAFASRRLATW